MRLIGSSKKKISAWCIKYVFVGGREQGKVYREKRGYVIFKEFFWYPLISAFRVILEVFQF